MENIQVSKLTSSGTLFQMQQWNFGTIQEKLSNCYVSQELCSMELIGQVYVCLHLYKYETSGLNKTTDKKSILKQRVYKFTKNLRATSKF
jgi:hypothetical protein